MSNLPRLTRERYRKAIAKGRASGWYALAKKGYQREEIALHHEPTVTPTDVAMAVREYARVRDLPIPKDCAPRREYRAPLPVEDWRAAFQRTVMRTGLVLSLTQPMLEFLCATADGVRWDRAFDCGGTGRKDNSLATGAALEKRGLVRRLERSGGRITRLDVEDAFHELTEAGEHVVALLKSVGVFSEADAAIRRRVGATR